MSQPFIDRQLLAESSIEQMGHGQQRFIVATSEEMVNLSASGFFSQSGL